MASKKPKMSAPVIVYTPAPAVTAPAPVVKDDAPEVSEDEQRLQNIMTRRRGRLGTIATSLNGVLTNTTSDMPVRKTLLGE